MEEWKEISGWEGLYSVSNEGRVKSHGHVVMRKNGAPLPVKEKILKFTPGPSGHYTVEFRHECNRKRYMVHRLIAQAFIPNPDNLPLVRHLNDIETDNRLKNLAWGTHSDNMEDALRNGRQSNQNKGKTHCIRGHEFTEENTLRDKRGNRSCKACMKIHKKNYRVRIKGASKEY